MARVDTSLFPTVQADTRVPDDYQHIEASPAAFGALTAQATGGLGQTLDKSADQLTAMSGQIQGRTNQVASDDAFNKLQSSYFKATYGDPNDPTQKGFYTMQGQDALNAYQPMVKSLDDARTQIRAGLQNDAQRLEFDEASRRLQMFTMDAAGRHYDEQFKNYQINVNKATEQNQLDTAGAQWNDDTAYGNSREESRRSAVRTVQALYGDNPDPALLQSALSAADSKVTLTRIMSASAHDPAYANGLLQKYGSLLDPPAMLQATQHLKQVNITGAANQAFTNAVGGGGGGANPTSSAVAQEAITRGLDPSLALTTMGLESGGSTTSRNPKSSASGVFQMTDGTWAAQGGTAADRTDPTRQVQLGVKNLADSQAAAQAALGRAPENWQTYVVSQQGQGGGAALLKANPAMNAIDALTPAYGGDRLQATRAVVNNGGSAQSTAGQFLGLWQAKYADMETRVAGSPGQLPPREVAIDRVMQSTADNPQAQVLALAHVNLLYSQQEKARRDAQEAVGNKLVSQIISDPSKINPADIATNPTLSSEQKWHYAEMLRTSMASGGTGDKQLTTYGPKFYTYLDQATAAPGSPDKITDATTLWKHVGSGELTVAGVERLSTIVQGSRTPEGQADSIMLKGFLEGAKRQISKDGVFGMPDPQGEARYSEFLTHAMPAYDAGRKQGLTGAQLLDPKSKDYIGGSIPSFTRSMPEMVSDIHAANGGSPNAKAPDLTTKAGIAAAYQAGTISRDQAAAELQKRGLWTPLPAPSGPPQVPTD